VNEETPNSAGIFISRDEEAGMGFEFYIYITKTVSVFIFVLVDAEIDTWVGEI